MTVGLRGLCRRHVGRWSDGRNLEAWSCVIQLVSEPLFGLAESLMEV